MEIRIENSTYSGDEDYLRRVFEDHVSGKVYLSDTLGKVAVSSMYILHLKNAAIRKATSLTKQDFELSNSEETANKLSEFIEELSVLVEELKRRGE